MSDDREGFLARWSRRKAGIAAPSDATRDVAAPHAPPSTAAPGPQTGASLPEVARDESPVRAGAGETAPEPAPLPTIADVAALTRDSDYTRFMAPGVDSAVRNAAMKKLFSDPRFNVMDGLDVYVDDYGKPDPLPLAMLKQLRQSELLGLFRDDADPATPSAGATTEATPDNAAASSSPPALSPEVCSRAENDPDLRLQPDDGDRRPGAGEGARD